MFLFHATSSTASLFLRKEKTGHNDKYHAKKSQHHLFVFNDPEKRKQRNSKQDVNVPL